MSIRSFFVMFCAILLPAVSPCRADETRATWILPNGLRVIVHEQHASPLVAIDLWVRAGSREEAADEIGSAHFLEHTLFKGTATRKVGDVDEDIENLGAMLDAATGPDYAHFYTTVSSAHYVTALAILADVVMHASLPDVEVERERGVILDELAQREADPGERMVDQLFASAFTDHPYHRSPGGTPQTISVRGRDTLASFYRRCYVPSRCTLVLVGDVMPTDAMTAVVHALGAWHASEPAAPTAPPSVPGSDRPDLARARRVAARSESSLSLVGIAFPAPPAHDARMTAAALTMSALLGATDRSGRLVDPVFEGTHALAHFVPRKDPTLFLVTAETPPRAGSRNASPQDADGLEKALRDVVSSLTGQPPSVEELRSAQRLVLGRMQYDQETDEGMAYALGYADLIDGDGPDALASEVEALTRADLILFARKYLDIDHCLIVQMLPTTDITRGGP